MAIRKCNNNNKNKMYCIKKGEKLPILIKMHNTDEDKPINLTDSQIRFQLKDELKDEEYIIEKIITLTSDVETIGRIIEPDEGIFVLRINDEDFEKLVEERIYYATIWWEIPEQGLAKVISGNCDSLLIFKICYP